MDDLRQSPLFAATTRSRIRDDGFVSGFRLMGQFLSSTCARFRTRFTAYFAGTSSLGGLLRYPRRAPSIREAREPAGYSLIAAEYVHKSSPGENVQNVFGRNAPIVVADYQLNSPLPWPNDSTSIPMRLSMVMNKLHKGMLLSLSRST